MILVCFDVDGTLDCSAGPVPEALLTALMGVSAGVVVVSPSGAYRGGHTRIADKPSRRENLLAARELYKSTRGTDPFVRLYVSDNKDYAEAEAAGFCYIEAAEFAKGIR